MFIVSKSSEPGRKERVGIPVEGREREREKYKMINLRCGMLKRGRRETDVSNSKLLSYVGEREKWNNFIAYV